MLDILRGVFCYYRMTLRPQRIRKLFFAIVGAPLLIRIGLLPLTCDVIMLLTRDPNLVRSALNSSART